MKNKIIPILFFALILINIGFSAYLWKQNKELKSDISNISSELMRLDLDALEKIKSKNSGVVSSGECGSWINPCE
ncbi:hypothetical protein P255_00957 [Acinetobacter brisouii CIP 110357]|uniref:Uncharacterized protein n=1 Tax=Acinetobacter brisouii CIP 110357 TaxID=1341683 RepID=V2UVY1_9GAMM|nr:hypothetical protein F954_02797 [Acinetobacter brisouii ANC 4119]ESK52795.1 hypothetical protein P255_00957 [Acinetobacter brisouii CIP 110357]